MTAVEAFLEGYLEKAAVSPASLEAPPVGTSGKDPAQSINEVVHVNAPSGKQTAVKSSIKGAVSTY